MVAQTNNFAPTVPLTWTAEQASSAVTRESAGLFNAKHVQFAKLIKSATMLASVLNKQAAPPTTTVSPTFATKLQETA